MIRAAEPTHGLDLMIARRGTGDVRKLTTGPGRLCSGFGIDLKFNGERIGRSIKVKSRKTIPEIATSKRVGITRAMHLEWRFYERGNRFVSR